ncbi:cysteine--tRNA ligase [Synechococcus sp. UW140]|uniref:cysteine--tRNA ligase n=1 Tax=Synechococcus sp. UW140 TaxID=368503 RepID=UPI0031383492
MALKLNNTLTRKIEEFQPLLPGEVSIYCCGVTVYDLCHLGHARSYIAWDVLRRYLTFSGYKVTFVQNYTDIDDKILNRALEEGSNMETVSERNISAFEIDMARLNIMPADRMPRATQCLNGIRQLITELEAKGAAYSASGDVYFAVIKANNYGQLSGRDPNEQQQGAGGRSNDALEGRKQHPFDFALWKGAKPGEPCWESPWGPGRPGWHIECSAMVRQELGETIDIHLGGADLIFPHHENEIAQSETATGKALARYWLHNGMVNVEGTKMSKSLGNFTTIRALLDSGISPMTLRFFVLQAHYRKPLDFSAEALAAAATGWKGLNAALLLGERHGAALNWQNLDPIAAPWLEANRERFSAAMDDDLNSSAALAVLFDLAKPLRALANRLERGDTPSSEERALGSQWQLFQELAGVLGLNAEQLSASAAQLSDADIEIQIAARKTAKVNRNFAEADNIRTALKEQGIELIDKPGGNTEWLRS